MLSYPCFTQEIRKFATNGLFLQTLRIRDLLGIGDTALEQHGCKILRRTRIHFLGHIQITQRIIRAHTSMRRIAERWRLAERAAESFASCVRWTRRFPCNGKLHNFLAQNFGAVRKRWRLLGSAETF